ncbi:MAG: BspA family leucine-rich repeat surface protein, partial [Bacteroidaceae bacterium]|nr:BspA family leucine-rich repeat surface protein [Bacteroidaceae bacterium]
KTIKNLNYLNTDSITDMSDMFYQCSSLTSLDLSHFNTSNVKRMCRYGGNNHGMFAYCSSLTSLDLSNFDTSQITDMTNMFRGCGSLTSLDLSSFTIKDSSISGTGIYGMFKNCSSLKTIYAQDWNFKHYCNPAPFSGCDNLTGGMGTKIGQNIYDYDENGNPRYYYCDHSPREAHIDGGKDNPGLFTAK